MVDLKWHYYNQINWMLNFDIAIFYVKLSYFCGKSCDQQTIAYQFSVVDLKGYIQCSHINLPHSYLWCRCFPCLQGISLHEIDLFQLPDARESSNGGKATKYPLTSSQLSVWLMYVKCFFF